MKWTSVSIPAHDADEIDKLVKSGKYPSRNEFVRMAVKDRLRLETTEPEAENTGVPA